MTKVAYRSDQPILSVAKTSNQHFDSNMSLAKQAPTSWLADYTKPQPITSVAQTSVAQTSNQSFNSNKSLAKQATIGVPNSTKVRANGTALIYCPDCKVDK